MTDEHEDDGPAGDATSAATPADDVLADLRQQVERIDGLELGARVAALEQVNDGLVRALGELDDL